MSTRKDIGPFLRLLEKEEKARDLYSGFVSKLKEEWAKELFEFLSKQEQGHVDIVEELLKIVE